LFRGRKDSFNNVREKFKVFLLDRVIRSNSDVVVTEFDLHSSDSELVEHVLVVSHVLRRALAEGIHQRHDSVLVADILDEDRGSKARVNSGQGEKVLKTFV